MSDPILKDQGITLRWYPVTDTSRIVIWFTAAHGRVATLVRGSQRPKSWVLGQYDLFYTCEILFYARAKDELHPLRECSPLQRREGFRQDYRACAGASFICDLLSRLTPSREAAPVLYEQATRCLDLLCQQGPSPALLLWFELQALKDLGVAPDLSSEIREDLMFDVAEGKIRPRSDTPVNAKDIAPITPAAVICLQQLLAQPDPARVLRLRLFPGQVTELAHHLQRFTAWHLDLDLRSRSRALAWC
jgi:DNA repair protein RecO (recombination protein O)